jgi:hypothetical protein
LDVEWYYSLNRLIYLIFLVRTTAVDHMRNNYNRAVLSKFWVYLITNKKVDNRVSVYCNDIRLRLDGNQYDTFINEHNIAENLFLLDSDECLNCRSFYIINLKKAKDILYSNVIIHTLNFRYFVSFDIIRHLIDNYCCLSDIIFWNMSLVNNKSEKSFYNNKWKYRLPHVIG